MGLCANDYLDREVDVSLSGGEVKRIDAVAGMIQMTDRREIPIEDVFSIKIKI